MKLNANIGNKINKQLKIQGVVAYEDEITLQMSQEVVDAKTDLMVSFNNLHDLINDKICNNNLSEDDLQEIIENFLELKIKCEDMIEDNDLLSEILKLHEGEFEILKTKYAMIISKFCYNELQYSHFMHIKMHQLSSKVRNIILDEIDKFNEEMLRCNQELGEQLNYIFKERDIESEVKEIIEDIKRGKIDFISDNKELEQIAIMNGYEFKSQTGSHRKFENRITKNCITIPNHKIGKGLSYSIQKQICANAMEVR